ncbi:MAG: major facilitator superfamily protein, partial [Bacteroidetes bacterium OLB12]
MSTTKTWSNYRWVVCALLFAATTINYIDRQVLSLLKPVLEKEFNWSEIDYSNIVMAFSAAYALGYLVFGRVVDWIGTKMGYAVSVFFLEYCCHWPCVCTYNFGLVYCR